MNSLIPKIDGTKTNRNANQYFFKILKQKINVQYLNHGKHFNFRKI